MFNEESWLATLLNSGIKIGRGPRKRQYIGDHYDVIIGIGDDHTATLTIDDESLKVLCERNDIDMAELLEG